MPVISSNTSFTLPTGSTLTFTEGGIGKAIVDGNGYTLGLADVILGPFTQAKTVQVLVTNAPISYYTLAAPTPGADRVPVVVNPLTSETSPVTGDTIAVTASRDLTDADAAAPLECVNAGITLTVPAGLKLKPGVLIQKHSSGSSIAFSGGATGNGASTTLAITGQMATIVPTATANAYRVAGV